MKKVLKVWLVVSFQKERKKHKGGFHFVEKTVVEKVVFNYRSALNISIHLANQFPKKHIAVLRKSVGDAVNYKQHTLPKKSGNYKVIEFLNYHD